MSRSFFTNAGFELKRYHLTLMHSFLDRILIGNSNSQIEFKYIFSWDW